MTTMHPEPPIKRNRIDTHGDGDSSGRKASVIVVAAPTPTADKPVPGDVPTAPTVGVSPCASPYRAAMTTPSDNLKDHQPTAAQVTEYRAKYGTPVPPTDPGEPEDPETFRALAAQLRGESG